MQEHCYKKDSPDRYKTSGIFAGSDAHLPVPESSVAIPGLMRKSSCACGGGCPSCQASAGNLRISQPNDAAEIEADRIADRVMRMPSSELRNLGRQENFPAPRQVDDS